LTRPYDLQKGEAMLRRAAQNPLAPMQTRQNLALVVELQGRFEESERIASRDLRAMLGGGDGRWAQARTGQTD
jgi:Flp pilus assembly protein TadD